MVGSKVFYWEYNSALTYQTRDPEVIHMHLYQYGMAVNCYPEGLLSLKHYERILMLFYPHLAFLLLRLMTPDHLETTACLLVSLFLTRSR
jgi:hypothetical protein